MEKGKTRTFENTAQTVPEENEANMKKNFLIIILAGVFSAGCFPICARADTVTIAAFDPPSLKSGDWLFKIDFTRNKLIGGWSKAGLNLEFPQSGHVFQNAWFVMDEVTISSPGGISGMSQTDSGEMRFYENGTTSNPLLVIDFGSSYVSRFALGADEIFAENVTITGSEISDTLSNEEFVFGFANVLRLQGDTNWNHGFTAMGTFSALAEIPEPAAICLLLFGALTMLRRKK